jgi:hypothetical protein
LQAAWDAEKWPRAAEIIRYSNAGWAPADAQAFGQWMNTTMLPQIINGSTSNGNWEISMIEGMINIGVYNNDTATFNKGVLYWQQRIPSYFYYHTDGGQPVAAPRGSASWYGQTVYDPSMDGISQETCRDFGHAQYGISGSLDAAETARIQGIDLFQDIGSNALNRLTSALEFNAYYLLNNPIPPTLCDAATTPNSVTLQIYPVDEIGYNEYHNRLGINLPNTLKYLQNTIRQLPDPTEYHIMVYESLTHGGDASAMKPFMLWNSTSSATLQSGANITATVTVVPGSSTNSAVALSVTGLPVGVSYSFSPSTVTGSGTSTLTLTASSTATAGSYALNITGASGTTTFSAPMTLLVNSSTADFSVAASPVSITAVAGDVANFTTTVTPISSYQGSINLSVAAGLPAGATASFSTTTVTNAAPVSILTVQTAGTTAPGAYNLTITATDGVKTHTAQALLIVSAISSACIQQVGNTWVTGSLPPQSGTFTAEWDSTPSTSLNNANVGLSLGAQAAFTGFAVAARFNPTGQIDARNGGAFVAANVINYTAGTSYHFRAVVNVPANTYSLYVTPAGQSEITVGSNYSFRTEQAGITSIDHWDATSSVGTISVCNMMVDSPDFSVTASPSTQAIAAGKSTTYTATVTPLGGYTGNIALSTSDLPSGVTASFNPSTVGGATNSSTMTVNANASTAGGVYPLTVTGTDGTLTHTAYLELSVNPPCVAPAGNSQTLSVAENAAAAVTLSGTLGSGCSNSDTLSYSVATNPSHGVITGTAPYLMYTPTTGYAGSDTFTFTATDANATIQTGSAATITINVQAPVSAVPVLGNISPAVAAMGSAALTLTVKGSGFTSTSNVLWNGSSRPTTFVSSSQVTAAIPATDLTTAAIANVTVSTSGTSGVSAPMMFAIDTGTTTVTSGMSPFSVTHGQSVSIPLSFTNIPSNAQTTVTCYNLPAQANCSYDALTKAVTLTTGASTPAGTYQVMVVSLSIPTQSASAPHRDVLMWAGLFGFPLGLMVFGSKRRRWLYSAAAFLCVFLAVSAIGCTSGKSATPQTSASTAQASTTVTITVN